MLHVTKYARQYVFNICSSLHEGEPIQVFYSTKKVQLSRFITDI